MKIYPRKSRRIKVIGSLGYVPAPAIEGGTTDHGTLTGLADDDHTQYHNDTRGDARYPQKAGTESITGAWTYNTAPTLNTNIGINALVGALPYSILANKGTNLGIGLAAFPLAIDVGATYNLALGASAGGSFTGVGGGSFNTFIGPTAASSVINSSSCTFIGYSAGNKADGANTVTAIGDRAFGASSTGLNSVFVGPYSGYGGTGKDAKYNSCLGYASMRSYNTVSEGNTAVGYQALGHLFLSRTLTNTIAIGREAGWNASGSHVDSILIGYRAGYSAAPTSKLWIGYDYGTNAHIIDGTLPNTDLRLNASTLNLAYTNKAGTAQATAVNISNAAVGSTIGFYGAAASTKLTVSGSRGGNAALASLLTQLATLGLITDGSTA